MGWIQGRQKEIVERPKNSTKECFRHPKIDQGKTVNITSGSVFLTLEPQAKDAAAMYSLPTAELS